eukprot:4201-Heterococcus_DN1.PRE.1
MAQETLQLCAASALLCRAPAGPPWWLLLVTTSCAAAAAAITAATTISVRTISQCRIAAAQHGWGCIVVQATVALAEHASVRSTISIWTWTCKTRIMTHTVGTCCKARSSTVQTCSALLCMDDDQQAALQEHMHHVVDTSHSAAWRGVRRRPACVGCAQVHVRPRVIMISGGSRSRARWRAASQVIRNSCKTCTDIQYTRRKKG